MAKPGKIAGYRDLELWREAMRLVTGGYRLVKVFPDEERFGLCNQMRRAVVSIPANVAEGFGRSHTKDFLRHLYIARGSLMEVETYITVAEQLEYAPKPELHSLWRDSQVVGRLLNGLIRSLEHRLQTIGPRSPITDHRSPITAPRSQP